MRPFLFGFHMLFLSSIHNQKRRRGVECQPHFHRERSWDWWKPDEFSKVMRVRQAWLKLSSIDFLEFKEARDSLKFKCAVNTKENTPLQTENFLRKGKGRGTAPRPYRTPLHILLPSWSSFSRLRLLSTPLFTARRNARIASAVLATAISSVCLSVCHTPVLCQNDCT